MAFNFNLNKNISKENDVKEESKKVETKQEIESAVDMIEEEPIVLSDDDERSAKKQAMYRDVDDSFLPQNESLETTIARVVPYFLEEIKPAMKAGKRVIIAAHGNSLRALVYYLDKMTPEAILGVNIPTATPLVYEFDDDFNVIKHYYLGDQNAIAAKQAAVANQGKAK